ncbi:MAG: hypothetical protein J3Q66DRAFT_365139 [Benniella sp.]|nr:MAG: hypothetical protein J3Q66DRAFT_365139 [Benniella sp.]
MKLFAAVATLILATFATAQSPMFIGCGAFPEILVDFLFLNPYPLCVGKTVTITVIGSISTPILDRSTLKISGRYLGRIVYWDNTHDLCSLLAFTGNPCPVPTSQYALSMDVLVKSTFPKNVPVDLYIEAFNGGDLTRRLFCQVATVTGQTCP